MATKVEFTATDKVNGITYKEGETLSVSASIANHLLNVAKTAKVYKPKKQKQKSDEE
jgi:hypothetical protein